MIHPIYIRSGYYLKKFSCFTSFITQHKNVIGTYCYRTPKIHNLPAVLQSIILTIANKAIGLRIQYILNNIIGFIYNHSKSMYILFIFLANINQLEDFFPVFYVRFVYEKNISYIF